MTQAEIQLYVGLFETVGAMVEIQGETLKLLHDERLARLREEIDDSDPEAVESVKSAYGRMLDAVALAESRLDVVRAHLEQIKQNLQQ